MLKDVRSETISTWSLDIWSSNVTKDCRGNYNGWFSYCGKKIKLSFLHKTALNFRRKMPIFLSAKFIWSSSFFRSMIVKFFERHYQNFRFLSFLFWAKESKQIVFELIWRTHYIIAWSSCFYYLQRQKQFLDLKMLLYDLLIKIASNFVLVVY